MLTKTKSIKLNFTLILTFFLCISSTPPNPTYAYTTYVQTISPVVTAGIVVNDTHILASDTSTEYVNIYDLQGVLQDTIGTGVAGAGNDQFDQPYGIAMNSTHILVVDQNNHRVQMFDFVGNYEATIAGNGAGSANNQLDTPWASL